MDGDHGAEHDEIEIETPNSSTRQTQCLTRGRTDPPWDHCKEIPSQDKTKRSTLVCLYCGKAMKGGGISRVKQHLVGIKSEVTSCNKVSAQVRFEMKKCYESTSQKNKGGCKEQSGSNLMRDYEEEEYMEMDTDVQENQSPHTSTNGKGNTVLCPSKKMKTIDNIFMPRTTPRAQPGIKSVLQSKVAKEKVDLIVSKWMLDSSIAFNASNSVYYQQVFDAVTSFGPGYRCPTFHELRGFLLSKNVELVKNYVDFFHEIWKKTGCTIMADGWSDQNRRSLINFLVYCPRGTVFLKSVDASEASKTTGRLLEREFPSLFWSPCAAHCLNLMFKDIGKLEEVCKLVTHASKITRYIYNHCYPLCLMRKHTKGREILRPAPTRFATNFVALQSILAQKDALISMVASKEWKISAYARDKEGKSFEKLVLDLRFWNECGIIVKLTEPLTRVLRLVDCDERPAMGHLYAQCIMQEQNW